MANRGQTLREPVLLHPHPPAPCSRQREKGSQAVVGLAKNRGQTLRGWLEDGLLGLRRRRSIRSREI
jgi:hypothetical protein